MKAAVLEKPGEPLVIKDIPEPEPGDGQLLLKVHACGVCRSDLHVIDGDLAEPRLPLVLGHQIVATVVEAGPGTKRFSEGESVGVPWLGWSCGECRYCRAGRENLCDGARYTGYQIDGGFAQMCVADERFVFAVPAHYPSVQAAPLLCAGLIGYRAYRMTRCVAPSSESEEKDLDIRRIGFYGFGSSASILVQVALYEGREVYAFTRPGDEGGQKFARKMGAAWAGGSDRVPPVDLDAAIIFAPVGDLVPAALEAVRKGGTVVCAGIHMSDIPAFAYSLLWGERVVRSVANLTRADGQEFLKLAGEVPVRTQVTTYALEDATRALDDLREGRLKGSAVILVEGD